MAYSSAKQAVGIVAGGPTIRSSRRRFAARLNSGVSAHEIVLALLTIALSGCAASLHGISNSSSIAQLKSEDEMLVAEAVLKAIYSDNASAEQINKAGASLCINGNDPPSGFIQRFENLHPAAYPCSASQYNKKLRFLVKRGTTDPMISFNVSDISLLSEDSAVAKGIYYEASVSSAGYSFTLSKLDGNWVIVDASMDWIS